jgi:hypothetical protein
LNGARAALAAFQRLLKEEDTEAYVVATKSFGAPSVETSDVFDDDADFPTVESSNESAVPVELYRIPLVNFCQALVFIVERDARDLYTMLRNRYRTELRDEKVMDEVSA